MKSNNFRESNPGKNHRTDSKNEAENIKGDTFIEAIERKKYCYCNIIKIQILTELKIIPDFGCTNIRFADCTLYSLTWVITTILHIFAMILEDSLTRIGNVHWASHRKKNIILWISMICQMLDTYNGLIPFYLIRQPALLIIPPLSIGPLYKVWAVPFYG